tara:strand:+ start:447 stop:1106 length:660 start_codon:yes stop_codon:yes gene_type:complete
MNNVIKCILIDLDGTLIDSGPDLIDSLNFVLKKQKLKTINKNIVGGLVGGGAQSMIERAYKFLDHEIPNKKMNHLIEDFLEFYYKNCDKKSQLYPYVLETLKNLKPKVKLALCTNKKQFLTEKIVKSFKIKKYFDYILGSSTTLKLKPDVEMLEYCMKKCAVVPENCLMIGDSDNDIIPANKLSMTSIFVNYGYGQLNKSIKPDFVINSFDGILKIINN